MIISTHICKAGTTVRVWMVSRFGDCGITDNLGNDARGYDAALIQKCLSTLLRLHHEQANN